jgi:DNA-binding transcriptional LysR family regulator
MGRERGEQAMDTLTSIRAFARIVELGSLTAAAADLGISNAMVSKHLKYLEGVVDARLLQRTTRSLCLTEEGRVCYEHYQVALEAIDKVKQLFDAAKGTPNGTLKITAPNYVADHYLRPVIASYIGRHPHMKLDVVLTDDMANIVEEGIDLALWVASALPASMIARRLTKVEQVIVAAPNYLQREGRPRMPADLARHMVLALSNSGAEWTLIRDEQKIDVTLERYMFVDSRFAYRLALDGMGIAMLPLSMVRAEIESGRLEAVLSDCQLPDRHLYAVYPSRRHLAAKVRAFVDLLAETFRRRSAERPDSEGAPVKAETPGTAEGGGVFLNVA